KLSPDQKPTPIGRLIFKEPQSLGKPNCLLPEQREGRIIQSFSVASTPANHIFPKTARLLSSTAFAT
ncbi:MAG TPA: hypothetical protein PKZ22_10800, partial [Accumulibacter sp.]|nr:hypothetical protein [Accumulibacter sp.]